MDEMRRLNSSKSAGQDGIPPGVLKGLSDEWLLLVTFIMNTFFERGYPAAWILTITVVLHKKGDPMDVNNHTVRGISISTECQSLLIQLTF